MFAASKNSSRRVVHEVGCHHLRNVKEPDLIYFGTMKEALAQGYHPCSDCQKELKRFDDKYKKINEFANENKMTWDISQNVLTITTKNSGWKIMMDKNGRYVMYHRNSNGISNRGDEMPGYHNQKVSYRTIEEYFHYIADHEEYRRVHLNKPTKKKGTPGYRNQLQTLNDWKRRKKVSNVYHIIDAMAKGSYRAQSIANFSYI